MRGAFAAPALALALLAGACSPTADAAEERGVRRDEDRRAEQEAAAARAERDREAIRRLRESWTNVWEAGAAVVEQALSRRADDAEAAAEATAPPPPAADDLTGYDERGQGIVPVPEAGTLVSRRV